MDTPFNFNWVDIIAFIISLRVCFIAVKNGFVAESFKILGILAGLFFSFCFYKNLGGFFSSHLSFLNSKFSEIISFLFIFVLLYILARYLRVLVTLLFKIEPHDIIDRWVSLALGIARSALLISTIFFLASLANIDYINRSLTGSFSFSLLRKAAPAVYNWGRVHISDKM